MTSAIVSATIDADFPVAGQDNDSQGFRDNFQIIKDGLATAGSEITVLQNSAAKLDDDNDFNGNVIDNAQTNRLYGTVYPINTSTATTNISLNNGEYQEVTMEGNHTLRFTDWPEDNLYAKVRLQLRGDGGSHAITFATEGGGVIRKEITQALAQATGASRNPSTGTVTSTKFAFPTANITGGTFEEGDSLYGTNLSGSVTIDSPNGIKTVTLTAIATSQPTTIGYSDIDLSGVVTVTGSTSGLTVGTKVRLSDVGFMSGISTGVDYFVFDINAGDFTLAATYVDSLAGNPLTGLSGAPFSGAATATFSELDPNSNRVTITVSDSTALYVGMPVKFTGTGLAGSGLTSGVDYYIIKVIDPTGIRLSGTLNGPPLALTTTTSAGLLTMVPTTVFTTIHSSQVVTSQDNLTLTTADSIFPTPFTVPTDTSRVRFVEAWTADGGNNVFIKYLGEYA